MVRGTSRTPWWQRAYNIVLRALPSGFRGRWGHDMRMTFEDRVASA